MKIPAQAQVQYRYSSHVANINLDLNIFTPDRNLTCSEL